MSRGKPALLTLFLMAIVAWTLGAVVSAAQNHAPYPDTAKGLKQQLKDMRELARNRKLDELRTMIKSLDFPDARAWYLANYGTPGLKIADYYQKNLGESQEGLENQMIQFAHQDGYFSVQKQNTKEVLRGLITSPEIFLASWELNSWYGQGGDETPFGYFVFVDGKFRWDSTTQWVTVE